jgi:hypothetical protein
MAVRYKKKQINIIFLGLLRDYPQNLRFFCFPKKVTKNGPSLQKNRLILYFLGFAT